MVWGHRETGPVEGTAVQETAGLEVGKVGQKVQTAGHQVETVGLKGDTVGLRGETVGQDRQTAAVGRIVRLRDRVGILDMVVVKERPYL